MTRRLDGNAIAGDLAEIFGTDLTVAWAVCRGCGSNDQMAAMHVYRDAPGVVGRCSHCQNVLLRIVHAPGRVYVELSGVASLELAQSSPSQ